MQKYNKWSLIFPPSDTVNIYIGTENNSLLCTRKYQHIILYISLGFRKQINTMGK